MAVSGATDSCQVPSRLALALCCSSDGLVPSPVSTKDGMESKSPPTAPKPATLDTARPIGGLRLAMRRVGGSLVVRRRPVDVPVPGRGLDKARYQLRIEAVASEQRVGSLASPGRVRDAGERGSMALQEAHSRTFVRSAAFAGRGSRPLGYSGCRGAQVVCRRQIGRAHV